MNIALVHYRVGETDGVSLEMDKWTKILENFGHNVIYIAGESGKSKIKTFIINELNMNNLEDRELDKELFSENTKLTEQQLKERVNEISDRIYVKLDKIIKDENIDIIVPNNIFSLALSIPIAKGIHESLKNNNVSVIYHHHDFYWERDKVKDNILPITRSYVDNLFPPNDINNSKHCVINDIAQKELYKRKNIESVYVPNVFDFSADQWEKDEYNSDIRSRLGIEKNDIFLLQATRVVERKAIEIAIDYCSTLEMNKSKLIGKKLYNSKVFDDNSKIYLVLVGLQEDDDYINKLITYAKSKGIKMIVDQEIIAHTRCELNEQKIYSLWDMYVDCDIITYPSIYEGWGNQFLEGIFSKKIITLFEYSVFKSNIKDNNFKYISLGDEYYLDNNNLAHVSDTILQMASDETIEYLTNKEKYSTSVEENFKIGLENFSEDTLKTIIENLINFK